MDAPDRTAKGRPADLWVGASLLAASGLLFLLAASGALGDGVKAGPPAPSRPSPFADPWTGTPATEGEPRAAEPAGERPGPLEPEAAAPAEPSPSIEVNGVTVFLRPGAAPASLAREKILVLPVDAWAFYSLHLDDRDVARVLETGILDALGPAAVSLEPLRDLIQAEGLGAAPRRLAYGSWHMVDLHEEADFAKDTCRRRFEELPGMLRTLVRLAAERERWDFEPRFVFALAVTGQGRDPSKVLLRYRVIACLYDLEANRIHSCTHVLGEIPLEATAAAALLQEIPGKAIGALSRVALTKD